MNFTKEKWTNNDYNNFIKYLKNTSDSKYKTFHSKIIGQNIKLIGIRTPNLKQIAKQIAKGNYKSFISKLKYTYYEERTIHGLILGYLNVEFDDLKPLIEEFLKINNNWATNDLTCSNLKIF